MEGYYFREEILLQLKKIDLFLAHKAAISVMHFSKHPPID